MQIAADYLAIAGEQAGYTAGHAGSRKNPEFAPEGGGEEEQKSREEEVPCVLGFFS